MDYCSIFKSFNKPVQDKRLIDILHDIRHGKYKSEIDLIRQNIKSNNPEKADMLKKQLPAFTPSATFNGGRKSEYLKNYSGYIHLDFDKLGTEQFTNAFQIIKKIPYTFASFRSPGGNGIKVFVIVTSSAEHHLIAYKQVQSYYENELKLLSDPKCKDITRLCFVSDDPDIFLNIYCRKFEVNINNSELPNDSKSSLSLEIEKSSGSRDINDGEDFDSIFKKCINFTELKEQYYAGNRNNFIYLLACNCNRNGIPENLATSFITSNYDLSENEIISSIKSAYHNNSFEFAHFANSSNHYKSANSHKSTNNPESSISQSHLNSKTSGNIHQENPSPASEEIYKDYLKGTPLIPDSIYNNLPEILKKSALVFTDHRERDVFLTGALAVLSGCMPNVKGTYAQQTVYPNLFSFIIAPAASGKGALKFAKTLADKYHSHLLKISKDAQQTYEIEFNEFRSRQRFKKKNDDIDEPPVKPPFKVVYIPANCSYAKIISHLEQNNGKGIICETEADTMGNVLKQDWGSYSDMLRKSFHHERISSSKKANNEYIEVNEPQLSVALSGTPNQVTGLIASAEDGLFSRFIFYAFKVDQVWKDVSPYACSVNLTDHFNNLSLEVYELINFLNLNLTEIHLTIEQWNTLNSKFSTWLNDITTFTGENAGSTVKRLGLILYRISMILTTLRKFEDGIQTCNIECSDSDFNISLQLTEIYLQHSILMFHNLPKQDDNIVFRSNDNKRKFFEALPPEFKRAEATELGKTFNLSSRNVDNLLKQLLNKYLFQHTYGTYSKKS